MKLYEFVDKLYEMGDMESPETTRSKKTLNESLTEDVDEVPPNELYTRLKNAINSVLDDPSLEDDYDTQTIEELRYLLINKTLLPDFKSYADFTLTEDNKSLNEDIQVHFPEYDYTPEDIKKAALVAINETGIPESEVVAVTFQPGNSYEYDHFYVDFANGDEEDISGRYINDAEDLAYSLAEVFTEYIEDNLAEDDEDDLDEDLFDESLTEARNPENEEVNAIIAKYLGKKSKISKKEQEVLDKYGISRNKYGDFVGPNGKELRSFGRKTVQGPEIPVSKSGSRGRQHWDWSANADFRSGKKDSFDAVDYANYLTKETPGEGEYSATNDNYYNRKKSNGRWDNEYPSTPSEDEALRPYSDKYQELKANVEDKKYNVENASGWRKPLTDEEIEAKIAEYRDQLMRDQKRYQDWAEEDQQAYDAAKQELDDFKASIPKRNK